MNQTKAELIPACDIRLVMFKGKEIRQVFHDNEWLFSVIDIVKVLSDSSRPRKYWNDLKKRLVGQEGFNELFANTEKLPMPSADGKMRGTEVVNTEALFWIVQSVPSKNAEPFKRWLSKVVVERIQEINDPEIAIQRAIYNYRSKGHDDKWIQKRIQTVLNRRGLTNEWQKRGITDGLQYALLHVESCWLRWS
jgi:prophage antirepressor-like protein